MVASGKREGCSRDGERRRLCEGGEKGEIERYVFTIITLLMIFNSNC